MFEDNFTLGLNDGRAFDVFKPSAGRECEWVWDKRSYAGGERGGVSEARFGDEVLGEIGVLKRFVKIADGGWREGDESLESSSSFWIRVEVDGKESQ